MVENNVVGIVHGEGTIATPHVDRASHTEIAHDDIFALSYQYTITINGDTVAGGGLALDGNITFYIDHLAGRKFYDASYIEDYNTVGVAHGLGQRAGARCLEIGNVHDMLRSTATGS